MTVQNQAELLKAGSQSSYAESFLSFVFDTVKLFPGTSFLLRDQYEQPKDELVIKVFERFDNSEFGLDSLEFTLSHDSSLQVKTAVLVFETQFTGVKLWMQQWFLTCLGLFVGTVSISTLSLILGVIVLAKKQGYLHWF